MPEMFEELIKLEVLEELTLDAAGFEFTAVKACLIRFRRPQFGEESCGRCRWLNPR